MQKKRESKLIGSDRLARTIKRFVEKNTRIGESLVREVPISKR